MYTGIYPRMYNNQPQMMPPQQIVQVNGKASIDTLQLAPNSSMLAMDNTAPIVWLCVSDGIGKVTATPYDIAPHVEQEEKNVELRLNNLENALRRMEERLNESNVNESESKQDFANAKRNKKSSINVKSDDDE